MEKLTFILVLLIAVFKKVGTIDKTELSFLL